MTAAGAAHAQQVCTSSTGWISRHVFDGTANADIPVATAVRVWGPTNEAFILYERRFPSQDDTPHELYLEGYECDDNGAPMCASGHMTLTFLEQLVGNALYHDQFLNPSAAIARPGGGARKLATVRRSRIVNGCDGDATSYRDETPADDEAVFVDLEESEWSSDTETETTRTIESDSVLLPGCTDRGASYARYDSASDPSARPRAVWRWDDDDKFGGAKNEVRHGWRESNGTWSKEILSNEDPDDPGTFYDQDHPSFDIDGTESVVAHRSREGAQNILRIRFTDDPNDPVLELTTDGDYPDFDVSSTGTYHVVWHTADKSAIKHATCAASVQDCTQIGNWAIYTVEDDFEEVQHAYVQTDGDRVFIVYTVDIDSNPLTKQMRVHFKTRCGSSTDWETISEESPCVPTTSTDDQMTISGRPAAGVDRGDNVFHVAYVQTPAFVVNGTHSDGDTIISTRLYAECQ